ncbi:MAG TPA: hypothetical protein VF808_19150 [Ktedonobacterales bacterium]
MEPDASEQKDAMRASSRDSSAQDQNTTTLGQAPRAPGGARITRKIEAAGDFDDDGPPTVERAAWLRDDDYWRKVTYMSATGKRPAARAETRPLSRPGRAAPPSRMRSLAILALVVGFMIVVPVGVATAAREASRLVFPSNIPGISQPTTVPATLTPTVKPTATPKRKK